MNAIALGPMLVALVGTVVGVIFLVVIASRAGRKHGAGGVIATIFGFMFLGGLLASLLLVRAAPSGPQAVVVTATSTGASERIVPVPPQAEEAPKLGKSAETEAEYLPVPTAVASHSQAADVSVSVSAKKTKPASFYRRLKTSIANHWPQQLLAVAILMVLACLMKVVANGRLGRRFGTVSRVGAGALALVLVGVVWELGSKITF